MQGQLVGVALSFLRNFGILSGASGVLGALSSGVASAALDDRFAVQRAQQKQVSRRICIQCRATRMCYAAATSLVYRTRLFEHQVWQGVLA